MTSFSTLRCRHTLYLHHSLKLTCLEIQTLFRHSVVICMPTCTIMGVTVPLTCPFHAHLQHDSPWLKTNFSDQCRFLPLFLVWLDSISCYNVQSMGLMKQVSQTSIGGQVSLAFRIDRLYCWIEGAMGHITSVCLGFHLWWLPARSAISTMDSDSWQVQFGEQEKKRNGEEESTEQLSFTFSFSLQSGSSLSLSPPFSSLACQHWKPTHVTTVTCHAKLVRNNCTWLIWEE